MLGGLLALLRLLKLHCRLLQEFRQLPWQEHIVELHDAVLHNRHLLIYAVHVDLVGSLQLLHLCLQILSAGGFHLAAVARHALILCTHVALAPLPSIRQVVEF